jgi:hypothetical protein
LLNLTAECCLLKAGELPPEVTPSPPAGGRLAWSCAFHTRACFSLALCPVAGRCPVFCLPVSCDWEVPCGYSPVRRGWEVPCALTPSVLFCPVAGRCPVAIPRCVVAGRCPMAGPSYPVAVPRCRVPVPRCYVATSECPAAVPHCPVAGPVAL